MVCAGRRGRFWRPSHAVSWYAFSYLLEGGRIHVYEIGLRIPGNGVGGAPRWHTSTSAYQGKPKGFEVFTLAAHWLLGGAVASATGRVRPHSRPQPPVSRGHVKHLPSSSLHWYLSSPRYHDDDDMVVWATCLEVRTILRDVVGDVSCEEKNCASAHAYRSF